MKIAINTCYGGYGFKELNWNSYRRDNKRLIEYIEANKDNMQEVNGKNADIKIVEIPDEAINYKIMEYDGIESVLYVLDGIIYEKKYEKE